MFARRRAKNQRNEWLFICFQRDRSGGMRLLQALTRAMPEIGHCWVIVRTFTGKRALYDLPLMLDVSKWIPDMRSGKPGEDIQHARADRAVCRVDSTL